MATDSYRAGGVGLRDKRQLVHQSDVGFVQDKLEIVVRVSHSPGCWREASKQPYWLCMWWATSRNPDHRTLSSEHVWTSSLSSKQSIILHMYMCAPLWDAPNNAWFADQCTWCHCCILKMHIILWRQCMRSIVLVGCVNLCPLAGKVIPNGLND